MDVLVANPKLVYKAFIYQTEAQNTASKRWNEMDGSTQPPQIRDMEDWNDVHLSVYRATRATMLQSLPFKIVNRTWPCNLYLKQIRIKPSDACYLCGQTVSMVHFLLECRSVHPFWFAICSWFGGGETWHWKCFPKKIFLFRVH